MSRRHAGYTSKKMKSQAIFNSLNKLALGALGLLLP